MKTAMECLECGAKFLKRITAGMVECKCPKCGGYDTEVSMTQPAIKAVAVQS